ncbi:hypothetical protein [Brevundimonas sp.]|uniref:hypothetical protein n=1 Tax=Brevundimonas sp. TaxID=1871086 RepID=UPI002FCC66D1
MRAVYPLLFAMVLGACAPGPQAIRATMPLAISRTEGETLRMGSARLVAGGDEAGSPYELNIWFDSDDTTLGQPRSVTWEASLDGYCRDKPTMVRAALIGPSGQVWRSAPVFAPAGPDRDQNWSSGRLSRETGGPGVQDLLDAAAAGGRFTVAIEDDEGQLWTPTLFDTLTPPERLRLFAANRAAFETTNPHTVEVEREIPVVVANPRPFTPPWPPRACPTTTTSSTH